MSRAAKSIATSALAASLCLPAAAVATHNGTTGGPRDFAVGGGTASQPGFEAGIGFAAHSGPAGERPTGHVRARGVFGLSPFAFEGEVTCLLVTGNRASFKYRFKHSDTEPDLLDGGGIEVFVEDNGEPSGDTPDESGFVGPFDEETFEATDPSRCDPPGATPFQVDSGNFVVHDAP